MHPAMATTLAPNTTQLRVCRRSSDPAKVKANRNMPRSPVSLSSSCRVTPRCTETANDTRPNTPTAMSNQARGDMVTGDSAVKRRRSQGTPTKSSATRPSHAVDSCSSGNQRVHAPTSRIDATMVSDKYHICQSWLLGVTPPVTRFFFTRAHPFCHRLVVANDNLQDRPNVAWVKALWDTLLNRREWYIRQDERM